MRYYVILLFLLSGPAFAQSPVDVHQSREPFPERSPAASVPTPTATPATVELSRAAFERWYIWSYNNGAPANILDLVRACLARNQHQGASVHMGGQQDLCPEVAPAPSATEPGK